MKEIIHVIQFLFVAVTGISALFHLWRFISDEEQASFNWFVVNILILIFIATVSG